MVGGWRRRRVSTWSDGITVAPIDPWSPRRLDGRCTRRRTEPSSSSLPTSKQGEICHDSYHSHMLFCCTGLSYTYFTCIALSLCSLWPTLCLMCRLCLRLMGVPSVSEPSGKLLDVLDALRLAACSAWSGTADSSSRSSSSNSSSNGGGGDNDEPWRGRGSGSSRR